MSLSDISAIGWMAPVSLFTAITATNARIVPESRLFRDRFGVTNPSFVTEISVFSQPSQFEHFRLLSECGCSIAMIAIEPRTGRCRGQKGSVIRSRFRPM
jgi:hypothetical protein